MKNGCKIRFIYDSRTGHLGIGEFRIVVDGTPVVSDLCKATGRGAQKQTFKTPVSFALALALYEQRGVTTFALHQRRWRRFKQNVQKAEQKERSEESLVWVKGLFGSIANLQRFIDCRQADVLRVRTEDVRREDVCIEVEGENGEHHEPVSFLERKVEGCDDAAIGEQRSIDEIEPDSKLRDRLVLIAREGLCASGLSLQQELILGRAILVCKLQELHDTAKRCLSTLGVMKDDVRRQLGDRVELTETYADWHSLFNRLQSLHNYADDEQTAAFMDALSQVGTALLSLAETAGSISSPPESLATLVDVAIDLGSPVVANLGVQADACRQSLREYMA